MPSNDNCSVCFEAICDRPGVQSHQVIKANVDARVAKIRKPVFITGDAFKALLTVRHKRKAINALVLGQLQYLDPTIGDASCEMRVPLILDMLDRVQGVLKPGDKALVDGYVAAHQGEKGDTKVRTVADAIGPPHDPAYDTLVQRIETTLGQVNTYLARFCITFTENSVWSKDDELNLLFSYRSKAPMDVAGEKALMSGDWRDLIRMEQDLRSDFAYEAVAAFLKKISALPRYEAAIPEAPQFFIENQLLLASRIMHSYVLSTVFYPSQDVEDKVPVLKNEEAKLPLLPIFNQILAILYMMFNEERGIVVRVHHDEMTPSASSMSKPRYTQTFAGVYYLLFKPNRNTGVFEVVKPKTKDMSSNFIVFDTFSKYLKGTEGKGLDSAHLAEHSAALASSNLAWLLLQYAATHPYYTSAAVNKQIDYTVIYNAVCVPQLKSITFHPTREQFPELNLKQHIPNETRPNLYNLWMLAREYGEKRALHDNCQAIIGPFSHDLYERINRPVDFQVDHIFAAPLSWVKADTDKLIAKHKAAPNAVFGPFIVRVGKSCFSFVDLGLAKEVLRLSNSNKKREAYLKIHPENANVIDM